jgi:hypothetical protein
MKKSKCSKKAYLLVESFITIGLFDCDHTQLKAQSRPKAQGKH